MNLPRTEPNIGMLSQGHPLVVRLSFGGVYEVFKAHLLIAGECIEACSASECRAKELNIIEESRSHLRFFALCICAVEHRIEILSLAELPTAKIEHTFHLSKFIFLPFRVISRCR